MAFQLHRLADTLERPDAVRVSKSSQTVQLYYRLYPDLRGRNRYTCLVVKKRRGYSFILTGYLDQRISRRLNMANRRVSVWYDDEGDMLEVCG